MADRVERQDGYRADASEDHDQRKEKEVSRRDMLNKTIRFGSGIIALDVLADIILEHVKEIEVLRGAAEKASGILPSMILKVEAASCNCTEQNPYRCGDDPEKGWSCTAQEGYHESCTGEDTVLCNDQNPDGFGCGGRDPVDAFGCGNNQGGNRPGFVCKDTGTPNETFTCDEIFDFNCHTPAGDSQYFACAADKGFICSSGHVFFCDGEFDCNTSFTCDAGGSNCGGGNPPYSIGVMGQPPPGNFFCNGSSSPQYPQNSGFECGTGDFKCGTSENKNNSIFWCMGKGSNVQFKCGWQHEFNNACEDLKDGFYCQPNVTFKCKEGLPTHFTCTTGKYNGQ